MTLFGDGVTYSRITIAILSYFCAGFLQDLTIRKLVFIAGDMVKFAIKIDEHEF